jgi:uncharacterized protein YjiK
MAKIARTPFNAARWLTQNISSTSSISSKMTGYCLFVKAESEAVSLNIDYVDKGCYMKIILTETSSHELSITFPAMEGVAIYDDGGVGVLSLGDSGETTLVLPAGATGGSYIDLICDGDKWYVQAMTHGAQWNQRA